MSDRTKVVLAAVVGPVLAAAVVLWQVGSARDPHDHDGHHHGHGRDLPMLWASVTAEERAAAAGLVVATKTGIARYRDPAAASAAGYRPPHLGAAHHRSDAALMDDAVLDPTRPESLVYWTGPNGEQVLVGAMFKVRPDQTAPPLGGPLTPWHAHPTPDTMCVIGTDTGCSGPVQMLHVFVFDGAVDPFAHSIEDAAGGAAALQVAMAEWMSAG